MSLEPIVTTPDDDARESRRVASRRDRHGVRSILWRESILKRVRHCGRYATGDTVAIRATVTGNRSQAGLGGVQTCGSVWACPCCSEKVNAERRTELVAGMESWIAQGGAVVFLTLTMSHRRGQHLEDLWDAITPAWNRVTSGTGWVGNVRKGVHVPGTGDRDRFGIEGFTRIVEVKHGANGWHPHVHALLFLREELDPRQLWDLRRRLFARWEGGLARQGYRVSEVYGIDLRPVVDAREVGDYVTKTADGAAFEVTGSHAKVAGKGGRTPFQILGDFTRTGDLDLLNIWHEYEAASRGRRQMTWSKGLRARLLLEVERTDEEIAADEAGGDTLARIDGQDFKRLAGWGLVPDLLEAAEQGQGVLLDWLRVVEVEPLFGDYWTSEQGRIYREDPALIL